MDEINVVAAEIENQLSVTKQKIIEYESLLTKMVAIIKNQEEGYENIIKAVSNHRTDVYEEMRDFEVKKSYFNNTGILMRAVDQITEESNVVFQQQEQALEDIKAMCKHKYNENCCKVEDLKSVISQMKTSALTLAEQAKEYLMGGERG